MKNTTTRIIHSTGPDETRGNQPDETGVSSGGNHTETSVGVTEGSHDDRGEEEVAHFGGGDAANTNPDTNNSSSNEEEVAHFGGGDAANTEPANNKTPESEAATQHREDETNATGGAEGGSDQLPPAPPPPPPPVSRAGVKPPTGPQERASPVDLTTPLSTGGPRVPLSPGFDKIPQEEVAALMAGERAKLAELEKTFTNPWDIAPVLRVELHEQVKAAMDTDLQNFQDRQAAINARLEELRGIAESGGDGAADAAATLENYQTARKTQQMEAVFATSGTLTKAPNSERSRNARTFMEAAFEYAISDEQVSQELSPTAHLELYLEINKQLFGNGELLDPGMTSADPGSLRTVDAGVQGVTKNKATNGGVDVAPGRFVKDNADQISTYMYEALNDGQTNPIEVIARVFQADITNHTSTNGNGRSALFSAITTALSQGLPPPLLTSQGTKMIRWQNNQLVSEQNMSPADAIMAISQGMDRALRIDEALLSIG